MDRPLDHVRIEIPAFVERAGRVDLEADDVVFFGHPRDVDPLTAELLKVTSRPTRVAVAEG